MALRLEQIEKGGYKHFMLKEIMAGWIHLKWIEVEV